ncbi:hypothetical protein LCGC14_0502720 [marine sediment metagenome]|uniref:Phage portal protein n=1 Tax=marine sediment metagenome TaxID=412755 RepID=A0A0F9S8H3_9ZZZZ
MSLRTALSNWVFSWFKSRDDVSNPTKRQRRSPVDVDFTDSMQCNAELTKGLYHNSYPGLKLSGAMAYTPIATPIWFMGIPVASTAEDNEDINDKLKEITKDKVQDFSEIHLQSHRDGTCWIYPYYSNKDGKVIWEFIQDETITDIIRDINTGEIIKLITDEEITISTDYDTVVTVRRQRIFTKIKVETKWLKGSGSIPGQLKDSAKRNVAGTIPIHFSNNKDGNEIRGHSDYERILSDLKNYHDIDYKWSLFLSKFGPKMVVELEDVKKWLENNGYNDLNDINIATDDIFLNYYDREKITYIFPEGAFVAYDQALKKIFRKLVEGSGICEILWGNKVSGNLGSYEDQMDQVVKLVNEKRRQKTKSYNKLFLITLQLEMLASIKTIPEIEIKIEWDFLAAISEETKSVIFKNFAEGVATLIDAAGITIEQLFNLWDKLYPGSTEDDFEMFRKGLVAMAEHKQYKDASLEIAADFRGDQRIDENEETVLNKSTDAAKELQKILYNKQK